MGELCEKTCDRENYSDEMLDQATEQILQVLDEKLKFHPVKDNYVSFEKYIQCEHIKKDELGGDCKECDIAWLIERCRHLEVCLAQIRERIGRDEL